MLKFSSDGGRDSCGSACSDSSFSVTPLKSDTFTRLVSLNKSLNTKKDQVHHILKQTSLCLNERFMSFQASFSLQRSKIVSITT